LISFNRICQTIIVVGNHEHHLFGHIIIHARGDVAHLHPDAADHLAVGKHTPEGSEAAQGQQELTRPAQMSASFLAGRGNLFRSERISI
jgi:hypothetical protein